MVVVYLVLALLGAAGARRLGMSRAAWILLPLTFAIAVAFTFPLFLAWRELHLRRPNSTAVGIASAGPERAVTPGQVTA